MASKNVERRRVPLMLPRKLLSRLRSGGEALHDGLKLPRDARRVKTGCRDGGLSCNSCAFVKLAPTYEGIGEIGQVERVIAREDDSIVQGERGARSLFGRGHVAEQQRNATLMTGELRGSVKVYPCRIV